MDIDDIVIDPEAIKGGVWVDGIPEMGDLRLRVRGLSSPQANALRARLNRAVPNKQKNPDGSLKEETSIQIGSKILVEAVLLDWDGITSGGKPVKYSRSQAEIWLTDPKFRNFADAVVWAATAVDKGRSDRVEEAAKNSGKP